LPWPHTELMLTSAFEAVTATTVPILQAWATVFTGVIAFGAAGLGVTTFLPEKPVALMAAPLAGVALWPLATLALYVAFPDGFALTFDKAALFSLAALVLLGLLLTWRSGLSLATTWHSVTIIALFCMILAPVVMTASIIRGEPALLYFDGSDHPFYAYMADWFRSHPPQMYMPGPATVVGPAVADPSQPYSAYPHLMLTAATRSGSFAYLALVSILSGQSGSFAYDAAAAIALIAACLGCAAVFSRSWVFVLCLGAALLTGLWYDYGHMGFLGKLLAYPLVLFTFGIFNSFYRSRTGPDAVLLLSMLAAGAALMHVALVYALLFISLVVPFLVTSAVAERRSPSLADLSLAACIPVVALIASGTLARPFNESKPPDFGLAWQRIAYLVTDLNSLLPDVSMVSPSVLFVMSLFCVVAWGVLVLLAIANRNAAAVALLSGPAVLIAALYALNQPTAAVQFAGFPYPAAICAAFLLAQQTVQERRSSRLRNIVVTGAIIALISLHIPRTIGSVLRYTRDADRRQMFAVSDFDRLQAAIGEQEIYVDLHGQKIRTIAPIVVELGRRNVKMVWSPDSWHFAAGFRGWAPPTIERIPNLRLIDATDAANTGERVIVETPRYKLVGQSELQVPPNGE